MKTKKQIKALMKKWAFIEDPAIDKDFDDAAGRFLDYLDTELLSDLDGLSSLIPGLKCLAS